MATSVPVNLHAVSTEATTGCCNATDVNNCYVEFVLEHSPSVSVCSRPFSALLFCSFLLFCPSPSLLIAPVSVLCFRPICLILSAFHIRIQPVLTSLSYYFCYCSAITPISPTPSHPDLLLFSVSYCLMICSSLLFRYV